MNANCYATTGSAIRIRDFLKETRPYCFGGVEIPVNRRSFQAIEL